LRLIAGSSAAQLVFPDISLSPSLALISVSLFHGSSDNQ
jgi:hypothetical protein